MCSPLSITISSDPRRLTDVLWFQPQARHLRHPIRLVLPAILIRARDDFARQDLAARGDFSQRVLCEAVGDAHIIYNGHDSGGTKLNLREIVGQEAIGV